MIGLSIIHEWVYNQWGFSYAYLEPFQTSMMEFLLKVVNS